MIARLTLALRESPVAVPALAAVALFVAWGGEEAGYPLTHWAPGGLIMLALLALALGALGLRAGDAPPLLRLALGALAAYVAVSFLSITWAAAPAEAWEGANRTLLYLLVFALFAWWPMSSAGAALVLCAWVLAMAGLATYVLLHVSGAGGAALRGYLTEGRLVYPAGYANASAAQWLMAAWPAVLLAATPRLPSWLRGALSGSAVVLAGVALLSQSRGSLYATPILLVLVFVALPGRLRTYAALVPVAGGIAVATPSILHVGDRLHAGRVDPTQLHRATVAILAAGVVVALVVAVAANYERRVALSAASAARVRRGVTAIAIATLLAAIAGVWAAVGSPLARVEHAWNTFTSPLGYAANSSGSRLTSGFGSQRYDFYRVGLDEFLHHPLVGIGVDNFQQQYLLHGRSQETPHYPHSVELRALTETGLLGSSIALAGLLAALALGLRAARPAAFRARDPLAAAVAGAALTGFAYWLVHGSFDWFFEFAGLGAPAFALLGIACSQRMRGDTVLASPRASAPAGPAEGDVAERVPGDAGRQARAERVPAGAGRQARLVRGRWRRWLSKRRILVTAALVAALAAALSFIAPWLSGLEMDSAARIWPRSPVAAYARLEDAAELNPLSDQPQLLAGSIALRFGDLSRAKHEFSLALQRVHGDAYATLELGAIASAQGRQREALEVVTRAVHLQPRDPISRRTLAIVRSGERVNLEELNVAILSKAEELR
jgi:tetratricopeptide (TPR) repeat protein